MAEHSRIVEQIEGADFAAIGDWMYRLMGRLFPICRSITGDGVRDSLRMIAEETPIEVHEVPTGTRVFDWTIPNEWNIRDAYVVDPRGRKVIDFAESNLHVMGYSTPIRERLPLDDLKRHLHSLPERPDWIPFRTSYYSEDWGFCVADNVLEKLEDGEYEVVVDSELAPGSLTYGEIHVPGDRPDEFLISAHICHPSMCNDNLSGVVLAAALARLLGTAECRYSYRIIFAPGTIGAITWLAQNESRVHFIRHGLVAANLGDGGPFVFKKTRRGDTELDLAARHALRHSGFEHRIAEFSPYGYDERQYNSPGFDLPVGSLTRTPFGEYDEYHTSADDMTLVSADHLAESLRMYLKIIEIVELNEHLINTHPKGEPQLGRRGLYRAIGHGTDGRERELAMLWILNLSDGSHSLLEIAERAGLPFRRIRETANALSYAGLLAPSSS